MSWPLVTLASIAEVVTGNTPSKADDSFFGGDIPFVTPGELDLGFVDNAKQTLTEKGAKVSRLIPSNSVMVCCIGSLGKVGISSRPVVTNQQINSLVINEEVALPLYVYYFCKTLKNTLNDMAPKTTVAIVNKSKFSALKIPLPPLETQKQIAAVLEKADQLRKDCKLLEQELNSLAQSVFIDMFGDPVTNPKGWEIKPLVELLDRPLQNGAYYPKEEYSDIGTEMVHMGDVFYDFVERGKMKRVKASKKDIEKYKLTSNDILISRRSLMLEGAAKPSLIEDSSEDLIFESSIIRLTPNPAIVNVMYLFYYLSNPAAKQHYIYQYVTGATIKGINQTNLEKVEILVPDIKVQNRFLQRESVIRNQKISLEKLKTEADTNFNALMQKAFSGELNLANAKT